MKGEPESGSGNGGPILWVSEKRGPDGRYKNEDDKMWMEKCGR